MAKLAKGESEFGFCDCPICNHGYREILAGLKNNQEYRTLDATSPEIVQEALNTDITKFRFNLSEMIANSNDQNKGICDNGPRPVKKNNNFDDKILVEIDKTILENAIVRVLASDTGVKNLFEKWLEVPFKEKRILLHNQNKEGFLIFFTSFPGGILDNVYAAEPGLGWLPVPNNIIPDLFCRTMPIQKYKPRDKVIHKADVDIDHFPFEKKCKSCERIFYTFTNTKQYCCDECGSDAYNERRRMRRHEPSLQSKKPLVKTVKICPICKDDYSGRGRTCGKDRCRKADQRKRRKEITRII